MTRTDTTDVVYDRINELRHLLLRAAYDGGQLSDECPSKTHTLTVRNLYDGDWTPPDEHHGPTLGDPKTDWCVTINGDRVTVWAAGDEAATVTIPGAGQIIPTNRDDDADTDPESRADIAAAALQQAQHLLNDAWRQLTIGAAGDDPFVATSTALIEAHNGVTAARRCLDAARSGDEERRIDTTADVATKQEEQATRTRDQLHHMIRDSGLPPRRLAELTGLSRQRVAQIKRHTRTW